jgi:signal transduction histidine kinase
METALFLLLAVLMGFDGLTTMQVTSFVDGLEFTAPLVFVALAITFLSRNLHLFRSMTEFNQLLSAQLAAREQEIAESYAQRQEVERQGALLAERQRIMRDMHDGMGGRLMSLAAQLRGGSDPVRQEAADDILAALDELRLIVDSLDTAGDDLGMALGAFRARMEPKLAAAGLSLGWEIDDHAAERTLSATAILDVYRILQEACSNVLHHADATRITVALSEIPGGVELRIEDDGRGIPEGSEGGVAGHGLANMRRRAAAIGGTIEFADNAPGLRISLILPDPVPSLG